jgi:hypothetical protein
MKKLLKFLYRTVFSFSVKRWYRSTTTVVANVLNLKQYWPGSAPVVLWAVVPPLGAEIPLLGMFWLQRLDFGDLFKGPFFPNGSQAFKQVSPRHCWPLGTCFISIAPMILAYSWEKWERRSRFTILPINLSSLWGSPLDLDLGEIWCSPPLLFLSSHPIALVDFVGFGREGLVHFVCSCHCIRSIGLSSPRRFGGESKKPISSWVLGTLDGLVA